jgi:hypothetical protein
MELNKKAPQSRSGALKFERATSYERTISTYPLSRPKTVNQVTQALFSRKSFTRRPEGVDPTMSACNEKPPSREIGKAGNKSEMGGGTERHKLTADDAPPLAGLTRTGRGDRGQWPC